MANSTVSQMRIRLAQLEMDRTALRVEAEGLCREITAILVPELTDIEGMDVAGAATFMDALVLKQSELLGLNRDIYKLEKALGQ